MSKADRRKQRDAKKAAGKRARYDKSLVGDVQKRVPTPIEGDLNEAMASILWSMAMFDNCAHWQLKREEPFCEVADYLKNFESRTWADVQQNRKQNHAMPLDKLCKDARDRLAELHLDDLDELWSFRFKGKWRLWGIKQERVFRALWWDPDHRVYPIDLQDREKSNAG